MLGVSLLCRRGTGADVGGTDASGMRAHMQRAEEKARAIAL